MSHKMGRKFDARQTLTEKITWEVARNCTDIALEFALVGYIDIATTLFNITADLNSSCRASWSPGLYFAWEATNSWPECIPAEQRTPSYLGKLENERLLWKRDTHNEEGGLEKLLQAAKGNIKAAWGGSTLRPDDLVAAMDLAIFQGKTDKAREILKTISENFHWMYQDLSKSRQAWSLLKDRAVAQELGLKDEKVRAFAKEVQDTFEKRMKEGPIRRPYEKKTMKELVQLCSDNTLKNSIWEETDYDPDNPPTTLLHKPATAADITALERKMGLRSPLPVDYKEFLLTTNGLDQWWNGYFGEPELSGTDAVHIYDATEEQQGWQDAGIDLTNIPDLPIKMDWPKFDHLVQINAGDSETVFLWMVEPETVEEARVMLWKKFEEADDETKKKIMECVQSQYGTRELSDDIDWLLISWCPRTAEVRTWASFREYLEFLAGETEKEDTSEEEDEQGRPLHSVSVFAYGLR